MTEVSYRPMSLPAIVSAIVGVLSLLGLFVPELASIGLVGLATGLSALWQIRRYEQSGARFAVAGVITSVAFIALIPIWHVSQFHAESPPGYARLDFSSLAKSKQSSLQKFAGEMVCLKGYTLVPERFCAMREFVLTTDGDDRHASSGVIVELAAGETYEWETTGLAVSGRLIPNPDAISDASRPRYRLVESTARPVRTRFGLAQRVHRGC